MSQPIDDSPAPLRYPQLAKEPLISSGNRGNSENRLLSKLIDVLLILPILFLVELMFPLLTLPVSLAIWSQVDALGRGQSPGKWLLGLHTIEVQKGESTKFYNGLVRNLVFAIALAAVLKTGFLWNLIALAMGVFVVLEAYFILILRSGVRIGDILANTRVFDYKDVHTQFIEQFLKKEENN